MGRNAQSGNSGWRELQDKRRREAMSKLGITSDWMESSYPGKCAVSGRKFSRGTRVAYFRGKGLCMEETINRITQAEYQFATVKQDLEQLKQELASGDAQLSDDAVFTMVVQASAAHRCIGCISNVELTDGRVPEHVNAYDRYREPCWGHLWAPRPLLSLSDLPAEWVEAHKDKLAGILERRAAREARNA